MHDMYMLCGGRYESMLTRAFENHFIEFVVRKKASGGAHEQI